MAKSMKAIINGRILLPNGEVRAKALLFNDRIQGIVDEKQAVREAAEVIDAGGLYVSPGLVDVHIHGYKGVDVSDDDTDGVRRMAGDLLANGVTTFLPTTLTYAWERLVSVCDHMRGLAAESRTDEFIGAEIAGIHLEGPFVNPAYKGAVAL